MGLERDRSVHCIAPRLEKVIANYNKKLQGTADDKQVKLIKVDIDDLGDLSSKYNVQAVPTGKNRSAAKRSSSGWM